MKILQLCTKSIFPERDGGSIAMFAMADGLTRAGAEVDVVCLNIDKLHVNRNDIPDYIQERFRISLIDVSVTPTYSGAIKALLKGDNYQTSRFYSDEVAATLIRKFSKDSYDIVLLETLFVAVYLPLIRQYSNCRVVLRAHNVENEIWHLLSKNAGNILKRKLYEIMSKSLRKFEILTAQKVDTVFCLSDADAAWFKSITGRHVSVVPLSIVINPSPDKTDTSRKPVFFHLASMEWLPHQQAIDWFLKEVWPLLNDGDGFNKICLAGRNMPTSFLTYANEVLQFEGEITSPGEWMQDKDIMIVPSFTGSGVRVKSIEGLSKGKIVITTPNGTEGIPFVNGVNMFVVNSAAEFAAVMMRLNNDPVLCKRVSEAAFLMAKNKFDRQAVGVKTKKLLEDVLAS